MQHSNNLNTQRKAHAKARRDKRRTRVNRIARWVLKQDEPFRQADIARALDLPRATVWRLLPELETRGILLYQNDDGRLAILPPMDWDHDY